jgi:hypothetical protein
MATRQYESESACICLGRRRHNHKTRSLDDRCHWNVVALALSLANSLLVESALQLKAFGAGPMNRDVNGDMSFGYNTGNGLSS